MTPSWSGETKYSKMEFGTYTLANPIEGVGQFRSLHADDWAVMTEGLLTVFLYVQRQGQRDYSWS